MVAARLLVVSGPSGSGKSSIVRELIERLGIEFSVSATTRLPRPSERHGVHYNFISRRDFESMIEKDELLEWAVYNNRYYGTPAGPVEETLADQRDILLEIEIQGARQVRERRPDAIMYFIAPPSLEELERRLGVGATHRTRISRTASRSPNRRWRRHPSSSTTSSSTTTSTRPYRSSRG